MAFFWLKDTPTSAAEPQLPPPLPLLCSTDNHQQLLLGKSELSSSSQSYPGTVCLVVGKQGRGRIPTLSLVVSQSLSAAWLSALESI